MSGVWTSRVGMCRGLGCRREVRRARSRRHTPVLQAKAGAPIGRKHIRETSHTADNSDMLYKSPGPPYPDRIVCQPSDRTDVWRLMGARGPLRRHCRRACAERRVAEVCARPHGHKVPLGRHAWRTWYALSSAGLEDDIVRSSMSASVVVLAATQSHFVIMGRSRRCRAQLCAVVASSGPHRLPLSGPS